MRYALLSVSDKAGLVELARGLADRGFSLISTGGTARALGAAGVPLRAVSDITGVPEMMDGRVKTLHPKIHGGILARRDRPDDLEAAERHGIGLIDVVVVNLYPFARAAADAALPVADLLEEIDIGGPSLVRAAAKNFRDVLVVVDPDDYPAVLSALDQPAGVPLAFRLALARKAFAHTAGYDAVIAATMATVNAADDGTLERAAQGGASLPASLFVPLEKVRDLRYGENPHQRAAWYAFGSGGEGIRLKPDSTQTSIGRGVGLQPDSRQETNIARGVGLQPDRIEVLQGKELSFTNLLDLDSAARIVAEFDGPAAVVIKHTNPCGAAVADSMTEAYVRARDADALAAYGGIVGVNRPIDAPTARAIASTFIEAVIAPAIDDDARGILAAKKNLRLVVAPFASILRAAGAGRDFRSIFGGMLVQERDRVTELLDVMIAAGADDAARSTFSDLAREAPRAARGSESAGQPGRGPGVVTRRPPTPAEWAALAFAWRVVAHVKSNAVIFTDAAKTLAIGAGQMSRVDAVQVAVMKAAARAGSGPSEGAAPLAGSVAASDAYFPFRDGLDAVAAAGATAVIQPGGSVRDPEVIAAADEHNLAMVFTGRRHFRH